MGYANYGERVAGFDSRLKYYDFIYDLIKQSVFFLSIGDYEHSLQNVMIWKGLLPFKGKKDEALELKYNQLLKRAENELQRAKRDVMVNNNKIDKIERKIIELHTLLNTFMHIKNMHIPTRIEEDPATTVATVQYD